MFAFLFNATCAVIYTGLTIISPDEVSTFTIWAGGLHTGVAFALAILAFHSRAG